MIVKLYKLSELPNAETPNNIPEGFVCQGELQFDIEIGYRALIGNLCTSMVVDIIDDSTFRTLNSIYRLVPINQKILKPKPFLSWMYNNCVSK